MAKKKKSPSQGEQTAIAGYQKQYEYSACEMYRLMQDAALRGITLAEPDAGIFDDLVLHVDGEVRATQVKTQGDVQSVALNTELISNSLIKQISASWLSIRGRFPDSRTKLRYIFAGYFSTGDGALANDDADGPKHSAKFAEFLRRDDLTLETLRSSPWSAKLETLQKLSDLEDQNFVALLNDLELHDHRELTRNRIENFPSGERTRIEAIQSLLPRLIARRETRKYLSEADIVRELGWKKLSQKNVHEFPVPDDFQDNDPTRDALLESLEKHSSGYLSLVGPPGTGKSTLLQTAVFSTPEYSVSRYLAYLPDQRHGLGRAEAGEFLNDLIAELVGLGLGGDRYALDDLAGLRGELSRQLEQASKRYRDKNRKTVIIIDGLDHVPREERPVSSFLKQLPAAQSIPEGVIIVLGTQTLDLADLIASIVQQAKAQDRCIEISPLSRAAIFAMANCAGLHAFVEREELYEACAGHPLTARYFVEALKGATSREDANKILSQQEGLGRSLDEIYSRVWTGISAESDAKNALGLLARADGGLTPAQLASAYTDEAVEVLLRKAGFLLSGVGEDRLSIFHNSFRLFVAEQTRIRHGKADPQKDTDFNRRLAEIAAQAPSDDPQHWMELRYRARSGDQDAVLRIGTADYFRRSLAAFRPSSEIYVDLRLTYAGVKPTHSRTLLLSKLLIEKEIEYRLEAVSQLDMVGLLIDLGEIDRAIDHALEIGGTGKGWLRLVDILWYEGRHALSRRVLEANEPLEVLFGEGASNLSQSIPEVGDWIQRAQRFRPLDSLKSIVSRMPLNPDFNDEESVRQDLLYRMAGGIVEDRPDTDIPALCEKLGLGAESEVCLRIGAARDALEEGNLAGALAHLSVVHGHASLSELSNSWKGIAAHVAHRSGSTDLAKALAQMLTIPSLSAEERSSYGASYEDIASSIYNRCVLSGLLQVTISSEVRGDNAFLNRVDDKIRELASIRVAVESARAESEALRLKNVVLFFSHAKPERGDHSGYKLYALLSWVAETIALVGTHLGSEQFEKIIDLVEEKVDQGGNNFSGSDSFRLAWASALYALDGNTENAKTRIEKTEVLKRSDRTPQEVVDFRATFAKGYSEIGLDNRAHASLNAMHADTFGYWLRAKKEPQYEFWAWSYLKACEADPAKAGERATEFARFILGMDETEGHDTARRLIGDLLDGASSDPGALGAVAARLMDSDLTSWAEIADSVLAAIARNAPELARSALLSFSRIVVPFYSSRFDRCIPACFATIFPGAHRDAAAPLLDAISKWCPPSERAGILKLLAKSAPELGGEFASKIMEAEELLANLQRKTHGGPREEESRSAKEFEAPSLAELIQLGEGKTDYGDGVDYSYARSAENLALKSSRQEIEAFLAARRHLERDAKFMVACAKSLLNAGDRSAAKEYFAKAEKAAFSGYWSSFMGGQKLELQDLRIALNGDAGREKGFDVLIDELASGQTYGSSLFLNLDRILDQVTVSHSYEAYWTETENHLRQYREYRLAAPLAPKRELATHTDVLAYLLAEAFSFHCPEILDHARAAVCLIAHEQSRKPVVEKLFALLHQQMDGPREAAALMYKLRTSGNLKDVLLAEAHRCVEHPDFVVSNLGERVLDHFGVKLPNEDPAPLPVFYSLTANRSPHAENFDPPPGLMSGSRPVWSDDPWTQTYMLRLPFRIVADRSSVEMEPLRRRCADFMRREGGREAFGPEADEALQRRLRRLDLKFSWRKLQPMAAQRAFGMMLRELARADEIDPAVFPIIWEEIGGPSLSGYELHLEARPNWIVYPDLPTRQYGGLENGEWLSLAESDLLIVTSPDWFVLAERTYFKVRMWRENAESTRLCLPAPTDIGCIDESLGDIPRLFSLDSLQPLYDKNDSTLICQLYQPYFGELREPVMTICPRVARKLEWTRSRTNPFELRDKNGTVVAKTLRWVDGTDQLDTYETEIFGKGQAILLSVAGRQQLEQLAGPVARSVKVVRRVNKENGESQERTIAAVGEDPQPDVLDLLQTG